MILGITLLFVAFTCCCVVVAVWRKEESFKRIRHVLELRPANDEQKDTFLDQWLRRSGVKVSSEEWILANTVGFIVLAAVSQFVKPSLLVGLFVGAFGCWTVNFYTYRRVLSRVDQIDTEIEGVLLDLAASLWTNPSIKGALENAGREASGLIKNDLVRVVREIEYGYNSDEALRRWADRNASETLKLCVRMIIICRVTGAKLAPVLERLAKISRERLAMEKEVEAHASQPKATAAAVFFVPIVFMLLAGVVNPGYMSYLWSQTGLLFLGYSAISISCGFFLLKRQVKSVIGES